MRNEDDEERLEEVEDHIGETADSEQATYESSKNEIYEDKSDDNDDDARFIQIEEDLKMIDSDMEK